MPNPETTSAEGLEDYHHYLGGRRLAAGQGEAWRDIRASVYAAQPKGSVFTPSISEPVLSWTRSGEVEVEDREVNGPWIKSHIKKGSFFLISGGAPYYCRWRTVSQEPHEYMLVVVALPLLQRALEEVFGTDANQARLRDISGFEDSALSSLMEQIYDELMRRKASPLRVQGLAQLIAIHLAETYSETVKGHRDSPSLPGYKLRQITDWMAEHVVDDFNLDQLAGMAGLSRFHFNRLFKKATGFSPSRYHINLRMNVARRLLRETKKGIVAVAIEVGYTNPSHFAQLFRRDTGLSPSDYRRQR
ncbi:MAG TPA: AraC family transcriptional regulator [Chthoniobacterales bacterium]